MAKKNSFAFLQITSCPLIFQYCYNLIIIAFTCEKKIVVPVQLCVLSTGFAQISPQVNAVCSTFPSLFPNQIKESDTLENCGEVSPEEDDCNCCNPCGNNLRNNSNNNCDDGFDDYNDFNNNQCRPTNRSNRSQCHR
ncbi:hypothetical protein Ami103574_09325 [Aminipila butyrica]|uniref:Uncharacterized protein n=1 Tax=Aminipila butyrica TaxID=433296 RepID=A0A858BV96_9FIRM|nr:hypothetical protein [Aminipila butyrica]QIB69517.1 hypothetical protein Ami103574_09325 [Aminipila butyrica]